MRSDDLANEAIRTSGSVLARWDIEDHRDRCPLPRGGGSDSRGLLLLSTPVETQVYRRLVDLATVFSADDEPVAIHLTQDDVASWYDPSECQQGGAPEPPTKTRSFASAGAASRSST